MVRHNDEQSPYRREKSENRAVYSPGARKLNASACSPVENSAANASCTTRALATRESPMKDPVSIVTL